ncbi:uncharacterized protein DNG_04225 [Cephalotrichum gorgonifer]|uniref:Uncharacterized protein n=1 Tax=Cephalotrichum gorgonifer TaxID=2041049 RepID=A0AAE8MY52_9PEZI|nr:uncharacterized protein DNG_04225 [Cephalotrichum gorgonifer]
MADLSLVMDAFHIVIGSARLTCTLPPLAPKALRAISRWQGLWDIAVATADKEDPVVSVMTKHGTEMCWLARKLVEVSVEGKEDAAYFQGVAHKSLVEVHGLVRDLGS